MNSELFPSHVDNIPNVRLALNLVGIDATLKDVQQFVSLFSNAQLQEGDVNFVRSELEQRDPSKAYYTKADRRAQLAQYLLMSPEGRDSLRWAMKRVKHEDLLDLFGLKEDAS